MGVVPDMHTKAGVLREKEAQMRPLDTPYHLAGWGLKRAIIALRS